MCVHWYFAEHFSELSYFFFSKPEGCILDELRVSFKVFSQLLLRIKNCLTLYITGLPFQNLQNKTGIQDKNRSKYRKIQDKICQKTGKVTKIQDVFTVFVK